MLSLMLQGHYRIAAGTTLLLLQSALGAVNFDWMLNSGQATKEAIMHCQNLTLPLWKTDCHQEAPPAPWSLSAKHVLTAMPPT